MLLNASKDAQHLQWQGGMAGRRLCLSESWGMCGAPHRAPELLPVTWVACGAAPVPRDGSLTQLAFRDALPPD